MPPPDFVTATAPEPLSRMLPANVAVRSWTYDHHEGYGCPPRDVRDEAVASVVVAEDGRALQIALARTEPCRVYEVAVKGVRAAGGAAPLHGIGWYTRNLEP